MLVTVVCYTFTIAEPPNICKVGLFPHYCHNLDISEIKWNLSKYCIKLESFYKVGAIL